MSDFKVKDRPIVPEGAMVWICKWKRSNIVGMMAASDIYAFPKPKYKNNEKEE